MSGIEAIAGVSAVAKTNAVEDPAATLEAAKEADASEFESMLTKGISEIEAKVEAADALVQQFAIDDSVPVHQVTMALEEARLAVDLAIQVRERLVEGYREIMNMQL